jgi:DNA-binding NtrC family response regulator
VGSLMTSSPSDRLLRLLVVDDDPELLALQGIAFGAEFCVRLSSSPSEALAVLATEDFDAVLSDFRMPIHDGAWLLRQTERLHPEVRRLLMSTVAPFEVAAWLSTGRQVSSNDSFRSPYLPLSLVQHFAKRTTTSKPRGSA